MSYTVEIVMGEAPQSYERALEICDELAEAQSQRLASNGQMFEKPSARMIELHDRLTATYPCITIDPDGAWSDGPLINNFGEQLATLGISFSFVGDVVPFLIKTANQMGFWVLDVQDEVLHLPGGAQLVPGRRQSLQPHKSRWQFWK